MKHLRKINTYWWAMFVFSAFLAWQAYGQDRKATPGPSTPPAAAGAKGPQATPAKPADAAKPVLDLTEAEKTEVALIQEKMKSFELQVQLIQRQIPEQRQQLAQQGQALTQKLAKAHGVDLTKYTARFPGGAVCGDS